MGRVALGFVLKWIAGNNHVPLVCGADAKICLKIEPVLGLYLQQAFKVGVPSGVAAKNEVANFEH